MAAGVASAASRAGRHPYIPTEYERPGSSRPFSVLEARPTHIFTNFIIASG